MDTLNSPATLDDVAQRATHNPQIAPQTPVEDRLAMPAQHLFKFDARQIHSVLVSAIFLHSRTFVLLNVLICVRKTSDAAIRFNVSAGID